MNDIIIKNAWICQVVDQAIVPLFGDLHIQQGKIANIQPWDAIMHSATSTTDTNVIDAYGRMVTVPMVNFHDHIYSRLGKGLPISGPMNNFENILKSLWWKLDKLLDADMIRASAQMAALESIRHGVTYIFDHHASPNAISGSLDVIADTLEQAGLRSVLCFETSDRNGHETALSELDENIRFLQQSSNKNIKAMLGMHASFTLEEETLQQAGQMVEQHNFGVHIHLAEDVHDRDYSLAKYKEFPVLRLAHYQLLNPNSILAHGIHLFDYDYELIVESGSAIAYNPDSNLNNAVGIANFSDVPDSIPILAGTDGMHANIARSLKQLFLLYRHQGNSFHNAFRWIQKIYFDQLGFVKRYFPDFPALQINDRADLVIWDYVPPNSLTPDNVWGHIIYGMLEYPVRSVVQHGEVLMENFHVINMNDDMIRDKVIVQGRRLFTKFKV